MFFDFMARVGFCLVFEVWESFLFLISLGPNLLSIIERAFKRGPWPVFGLCWLSDEVMGVSDKW